jgi:hypothetical protein
VAVRAPAHVERLAAALSDALAEAAAGAGGPGRS